MGIEKSKGIVLHSRPMGDSDVLSKIFTEEFGKRRLIFKGLKKSKVRPRSACEPGTLLDLIYYFHENREINIVKEFNIENQLYQIRDSLDKIYHLYYILELVDKTTGYDDSNETVFRLLQAGIKSLCEADNNLCLSSFFTIHLLKIHGILPDFQCCRKCRDESFAQFKLDIADLGLICGNCSDEKTGLLDKQSRDFINSTLSKKFSNMDQTRYTGKSIKHLLFHIVRFIENYFHIDIKASRYITGN